MSEIIREVEQIVDSYHKQSPVFLLNRKTALYYALTLFEDQTRLGSTSILQLTSDKLRYSFFVREQLDALNIVIQWIFRECRHSEDDELDMRNIHDNYVHFGELFENYAKKYSPIDSAYVSYSRKIFTAEVNDVRKVITFSDNPSSRDISISDMMESITRDNSGELPADLIVHLQSASDKLLGSIKFIDDKISYRLDDEVFEPFRNMMQLQWDKTSELPENWVFDSFSISDFKICWIAIASLSMIHMLACLKSGIKGADIEEAVIIKSREEFASIIESKTNVSSTSIFEVLKLLTYSDRIRNNDIIYQPFVEIDNNKLALSPHLIMESRPERNLVSLLHKIGDKAYFDLTNLREGLMQDEITEEIGKLFNLQISVGKPLPKPLPDVDYSIYDKASNTILVCELKWLVKPDSTQEVFSRTQDLEHGCNQISSILKYASSNCSNFCTRLFGKTKFVSTPDVLGCVISKNSIKVENTEISVISMSTLLEMFKTSKSALEVFEAIKNRSFLLPPSQNFEYGLKTISYAGYKFRIPALLKEDPSTHGSTAFPQEEPSTKTYRRVGPKIGRNDPCPCGSPKKFKECCGRRR